MSNRIRSSSIAHATLAGDALHRRRRTDRLLAHEEAERARIAKRLERDAAHALVTAVLQLVPLERDAADESTRQRLGELRSTLAELVVELRELSVALHPPLLDELGLAAALEGLADAAGEEWLRPIAAVVEPELDVLAPQLALALFRICEDLLAATAGPTQLRLRLRAPDRLQLVVAVGEGQVPGRVVETRRLALARARVELLGGVITVADRRGGGVLVHAELPVP